MMAGNWKVAEQKVLDEAQTLFDSMMHGVFRMRRQYYGNDDGVFMVDISQWKNLKSEKDSNTKDFGTGFYCTVIKEQAQRWARRYNTKVVSIYDVRLNTDLTNKRISKK